MTDQLDYVRRVLTVFQKSDNYDGLLWNVHDDGVRFSAKCSDVFMWGFADGEGITLETLPTLEQAYADLDALQVEHHFDAISETPYLYAARVRGLRPQGAMYKYLHEVTWPLFNACGPERGINLFNPHKIPGSGAAQ